MIEINTCKPIGVICGFPSLMEMACKSYVLYIVVLLHMCILTKAFDNVKMSEVSVIACFL